MHTSILPDSTPITVAPSVGTLMPLDLVKSSVYETFLEITRYPEEILQTDSNLEEDLGIDSVKLAEIFSILVEKFNLPSDVQINPAELTTIDVISSTIHDLQQTGGADALASQAVVNTDNGTALSNGSATVNEAATPVASSQPTHHVAVEPIADAKPVTVHAKESSVASNTAALSLEEVNSSVYETFLEITRYPEEILQPDSNLEEDLGIDSVKLAEIFSILVEKFNLPSDVQINPAELTTINVISSTIHDLQQTGGAVASASQAVVNTDNGTALSNGSATVNEAATPVASSQPTHQVAVEPIADATPVTGHTKESPATESPAAVSSVASNTPALSLEEVKSSVYETFLEITRYPEEILQPDSNLEEDLGIDSVKLAEIFSILVEKFNLPSDVQINPAELTTIDVISSTIHQLQGSGASAAETSETTVSQAAPVNTANVTPQPVSTTPEVVAAASNESVPAQQNTQPASAAVSAGPIRSKEEVKDTVYKTFLEITRYPEEILQTDSNLEEDLGIDSVKLAEIFSILVEKFNLPTDVQINPAELTTIDVISNTIYDLQGTSGEASATVAEAPQIAAPVVAKDTQHVEGRSNTAPANASDSKVQSDASDLTYRHKPLKGKIGVISGSGRGLGKVLAHHLAKLGATVIVNSFHSRDEGIATANEIVQEGGDAHHIWGSFANLDHLHEIFDQVEAQFGEMDFFISNASNGMLAELKDITPAQMEKGFRTNIIGFQQGVIRSTELMKKKGGGKIIAMSSPAAHGYVEYFGLMGALKAAVESMVRSYAVELEKDNIQVNTVSPGPVYGELLKKWPDSEKLVKAWEDSTPHKRLVTAEDVAETIAFMLSDSAHMFNGSCVVMDGGISVRGW